MLASVADRWPVGQTVLTMANQFVLALGEQKDPER
jgi:hypothetical protein